MNKQEIIARMAQDADLTNAKAVAAYNSLLAGIADALANGERVMLGGFGSFQPAERKARQVLHPITKEPVQVKEKKTVKFKIGIRLQEQLDGK